RPERISSLLQNLIFGTDRPRLKTRMPLWLAIVQCAVSVEASSSTVASSGTAAAVVVVSSHSIGSGLRVIARATCVCRKPRPLDLMRESLNVGADGRADLPILEPGCFALQIQEPT